MLQYSFADDTTSAIMNVNHSDEFGSGKKLTMPSRLRTPKTVQ